jgi:hypothetical protein
MLAIDYILLYELAQSYFDAFQNAEHHNVSRYIEIHIAIFITMYVCTCIHRNPQRYP